MALFTPSITSYVLAVMTCLRNNDKVRAVVAYMVGAHNYLLTVNAKEVLTVSASVIVEM